MSEHTAASQTTKAPDPWAPVTTYEGEADGVEVDIGATPWSRTGAVFFRILRAAYLQMTPAQAREIAAGLVKAAGEAETRWPESVWPDPNA